MDKQTTKYQECKILIVDDTPKNINLLIEALKPLGCQLAFATSGEQMLEIIPSLLADVILLDVMMEGMSGFEACQQLKSSQLERIRNIPVIFVTAMSEVEHLARGFEVGGVDYIGKPIQTAEVIARARTHLDIQLLNKAQQEMIFVLESSLEERSNDVAGMGYDLRNQLNGLLGFTDMLRDNIKANEMDGLLDDLDRIDQAGHQILHAVNEVLDMAKISAGKMRLNIDQFDMRVLLDSLLFDLEAVPVQHNGDILQDKHVLVRSDTKKIKQVLLNLLSSLHGISQHSQVKINVMLNDDQIYFRLHDACVQHKKIMGELIFDETIHINGSRARNYGGSSLSTTINQKLMNLLGGKITIDDSDKSPIFILQIPRFLEGVS